jgi:Ni,Fe-hydrogenase III component G
MEIADEIREKLKDRIIDWYQHSERRFYFSIKPEDIIETVKFLFRDLNLRFNTATGIDTPSGLEIIYHFSFDKEGKIFSVRTLIEDKSNPQIDSITPIIKGAEWIEREIWEMLGINFRGHPNLKRLLLADDWPQEKFPLRHE